MREGRGRRRLGLVFETTLLDLYGLAASPGLSLLLRGACRWRLRERGADRVEHGHIPVDERV